MRSNTRDRSFLKKKIKRVIKTPDSASKLYNTNSDFKRVCDYLDKKYGIADDYFRQKDSGEHPEAITSIFVAGGEEKSLYSDLDIMIVFRDEYLEYSNKEDIKETLKKTLLSEEIDIDKVKLYLCKEKDYHNPEKPELKDKELSDYLNDYYKPGEAVIEEVEDWGDLASMYQLAWKVETGETQFGEKIIESLKDTNIKIPAEEGYELYIIQTRKFLEGFFNRKQYRKESTGQYTDYLIKQHRKLAKAILRGVDGLHILLEQKALISSDAIKEKSDKYIFQHSSHKDFRELVNAAYLVKKEDLLFNEALKKVGSEEIDPENLKYDILGFFTFLKNVSRNLIYEFDYIWNDYRINLLTEYYQSNTPELLRFVQKIKDQNLNEFESKFPALNFYVDGILTFLEHNEEPAIENASKNLLQEIAVKYKDLGKEVGKEALITQGKIFLKLKDYESAKNALENALSKKTEKTICGFMSLDENLTLADVHKGLGITYLENKDIKKARKHLRKAVKLNPRDHMSWENLAKTYGNLNSEKQDYLSIAEALKPPQNLATLEYASEIAKYWKADLIKRIKQHTADTKGKIDEYYKKRLDIAKIPPFLGKQTDDRLKLINEGLQESRSFLDFQKNRLKVIKKIGNKFLFRFEKDYYYEKRQFKAGFRQIDEQDNKKIKEIDKIEKQSHEKKISEPIPEQLKSEGPWYKKENLFNKLALSVKSELAAIVGSITGGEIALYAERALDAPTEILDGTRLTEGIIVTTSFLLLISKLLSRENRIRFKSSLEDLLK